MDRYKQFAQNQYKQKSRIQHIWPQQKQQNKYTQSSQNKYTQIPFQIPSNAYIQRSHIKQKQNHQRSKIYNVSNLYNQQNGYNQSPSTPSKPLSNFAGGTFLTFAVFTHNVLRVQIKNRINPNVVYENEFTQKDFEEDSLEHVGKTLIGHMQKNRNVTLSQYGPFIYLTVSGTSLPLLELRPPKKWRLQII